MHKQKEQDERVRESERMRAEAATIEDLAPDQLDTEAITGGDQAVQKKWLPGNV